MAVVGITYYTDPCCPWSWAIEPVLRKLVQKFGSGVRFTYVMCGMAREFEDPQSVIGEILAAGEASAMPVDPRLWLQTPLRSSHPTCIAVKAAAEQGDPGPYLRRLREGILCRRRKLDTVEALVEQARATPGIDVRRFELDLRSHATLEAFAADLDRAAAVPEQHHAEGSGRVKIPSLEVRGEDGSLSGCYGPGACADPAAVRELVASRGAHPAAPGHPPDVEQALRRFGSMATPEVAAVCELPGPRAPAELWRLASEWRVKPERVGSGELWSLP